MKLNQLPSTLNRLSKCKRLGRGRASGHGETSTRGNKGGNARSGYSTPHNFSGIPWYRKFPKRGFNHIVFKKCYNVINLDRINALLPTDFSDSIDRAALSKLGLIKYLDAPVKFLGNGEWARKVTFQLTSSDKMSAGAKSKIEAAGGKVVVA